jgi:hypothetical protein
MWTAKQRPILRWEGDGLFELREGCGVGAPSAVDPAGPLPREAGHDRHAGCGETLANFVTVASIQLALAQLAGA